MMHLSTVCVALLSLVCGVSGVSAGGEPAGKPVEVRKLLGGGVLALDFGIQHVFAYENSDFDGDGIVDLSFIDDSRQFVWYTRSSADGGMMLHGPFEMHFDVVTVSDLDGNGWADLISVEDGADPEITVRFIEDGEVVSTQTDLMSVVAPGAIGMGVLTGFLDTGDQVFETDIFGVVRASDLNTDGHVDVVIAFESNSAVLVRWGAPGGNGSFPVLRLG